MNQNLLKGVWQKNRTKGAEKLVGSLEARLEPLKHRYPKIVEYIKSVRNLTDSFGRYLKDGKWRKL